ncbi:hypothetical protein RhiirA4_480449 [Rhizophagus irregularis]|uniref:Uncharacterized protein n=1 Tax=Rhizophagus irregularis TaxID=588596 RepID=A0A2I1HHY7_9GLOM|nr:hypothetical protein RhiirA4_480449 [Rhizophagus irregularis]
MIVAIHKKTKISCEKLIQEAIDNCAVQNIINIDLKKHSNSEKVAFDSYTKKIFDYSVKDDIIEEIHKFPFLLQRLIVKEACAVINKLEKGKGALDLTLI